MEEFITIEMLGTLTGCSVIVTLMTQVFKQYLPQNIDTKWLALFFSILVGTLRIFYIAQFDFEGIVTGIINIIVLLAVSIGLYEIGNTVYNKLKKE